jgi:hypothetical protein
MGFHVQCTGSDLLHALSADPVRTLNEPYAFYIIALCTSLDPEMLNQLSEQRTVLDSMSGPFAAIMLFYNEAILDIDTTGRNHSMLDFKEPKGSPIRISSWSLRGGSRAIDALLRHQAGAFYAQDVHAVSMTYESDSIARELGLGDELPCLLILPFDTHKSSVIVPIDTAAGGAAGFLRQLLWAFSRDPESQEFRDALVDWHRLESDRLSLEADLGGIVSLPQQAPPPNKALPLEPIVQAREALVAEDIRSARQIIGHAQGAFPRRQEFLSLSSEIAKLSRSDLADKQAVPRIAELTRDGLKVLDEEIQRRGERARAVNSAQDQVNREAARRNALQREIQSRIASVEIIQRTILVRLSTLECPDPSDYVERLKRSQQRDAVIGRVSYGAGAAWRAAPGLIERVLTKAIQGGV